MRLFLIQLGWEFRKLAARPRTWFGFVAIVTAELLISALLRFPAVRAAIARDLWKMQWGFHETFSGLTTAAHIFGEVMTTIGALSLALVAGEIVAGEGDRGTIRTLFSRPVSRGAILFQKGIVCAVFSVVLTVFCGASALLVGLLFEGRGPLVMVAIHESVMGAFDFSTGLHRYTLAVALFCASAFSGSLLAFAFSCCKVKPAAAVALALTILFADTAIRVTPALGSVSPYCVTTRLLAWRQVFNDEIPWPRIARSYRELLWWDAACAALAWGAFRRREF